MPRKRCPCAGGCGRLLSGGGTGSLPPGLRTCRECRRAARREVTQLDEQYRRADGSLDLPFTGKLQGGQTYLAPGGYILQTYLAPGGYILKTYGLR